MKSFVLTSRSTVKKALCILLCALVFMPFLMIDSHSASVWDGSVASSFSGGNGSASSPYVISSPSELALFSGLVNGTVKTYGGKNAYRNDFNSAYYILSADIILNSTASYSSWQTNAPANSFTPIGYYTSSDANAPFCGVFDGRGHSITGLYVSGTKNRQGLFGLIEDGAVFDLALKKAYINGNRYVGGICGMLSGSSSCISGCSVDAVVSGSTWVGGIVGNSRGAVSVCSFSGEVKGSDAVGGIVGKGDLYSSVINCENGGAVSGYSFCGGIIGGESEECTLLCSVNYGKVTGTSSIGAIAGNGCGELTSYCYYLSDSQSKGIGALSSGKDATVGLSSAQFKNSANFAGLDFGNLWRAGDGHPTLSLISGDCSGAVWDGRVATKFASGTGTKADPFVISSASELAYLSSLVKSGKDQSGKYFILSASITLNKYGAGGSIGHARLFDPIGNEAVPFKGNFNGKGHSVYGLFISGGNGTTGLFGCSAGTISSVSVRGGLIIGGSDTGAVVGKNCGIVSDCFSNADVIGSRAVGSICGSAEKGSKITSCSSSAKIKGGSNVGGIVGYAYSSGITGCSSKSVVFCGESAGGIIGHADSETKTENSSFSGSVEGGRNIGGIYGSAFYYSTVSSSLNSGSIKAMSEAGGILGSASWRCGVSDCLNIGTVTASEKAGGIVGSQKNNSFIKTSVSRGATGGSGIVSASELSYVTGCYYQKGTANGGVGGKNISGSAVAVDAGAPASSFPLLDFSKKWTYEKSAPVPMVFAENVKLSKGDIASSVFSVDFTSGAIYGIPAGTTVSGLKNGLKCASAASVKDKNGKTLAGTSVISTGDTISLTGKTGYLTLSVKGDVNGDGKASITDFILIKTHILSGGKTLTGVFLKAGDLNGDGALSITDFVIYKTFLLGKGKL